MGRREVTGIVSLIGHQFDDSPFSGKLALKMKIYGNAVERLFRKLSVESETIRSKVELEEGKKIEVQGVLKVTYIKIE